MSLSNIKNEMSRLSASEQKMGVGLCMSFREAKRLLPEVDEEATVSQFVAAALKVAEKFQDKIEIRSVTPLSGAFVAHGYPKDLTVFLTKVRTATKEMFGKKVDIDARLTGTKGTLACVVPERNVVISDHARPKTVSV